MSYSLNAAGHIPWEGQGGQTAEEIERELHEKLSTVLADPKYGCSTSSFGGSHVSGTMHQHFSQETEHTHEHTAPGSDGT